MRMEGGGCWGLAPGQITDDSELAMCLMRGLISGKGKLDASHICKNYGLWYADGPFDIGMTTKSALKYIKLEDPKPSQAREAALRWNAKSLSNGSLMRITPLAVWGQNLSDEDLSKAAKEDTTLVHSNPLMSEMISIYCIAIKILIQNCDKKDRVKIAMEGAQDFANSSETKQWLEESI